MIQTKFNYTSGGEFQLSGSDYIGYFNINDEGLAYTGRYYDSNSKLLLTPESVYSADYYRSSNFRDRFVFDTLTLPYDYTKIEIQPNEIVTYETFNTKIKYLHDNLIYLHSKMFMGSTNTPSDNSYTVLCNVLGTSGFDWNITPSSYGTLSTSPTLSGYAEFDTMKKMVIIPMNDNIGYSIFGITDTYLIGLTSKNVNNTLTGAQFTLYTNVIDNNTNQKCINLSDIMYDGRYLYITDSQINSGGQVFKYDVTGYYTNDEVFDNKIFLIDQIGGIGSLNKNTKFNGCTVLGYKDDNILVYDSGNGAIKVFDSNFVWKQTIKISTLRNYTVLDMKNRKINNHLYVLYENLTDLQFGLFEYDETYQLINNYIFEDVLNAESDIRFKRIAFSEQDSNVFYALTNGTVYKKFFSKPEKTFAIFSRDEFYPDDNFVWDLVDKTWDTVEYIWNLYAVFKFNLTVQDIAIIPDESNHDNMFLLGPSCIYKMKERTDYESVLRDQNLKYYNYSKIELNKKEYNQALTYNKELYKLFSNIIQFKNNLVGRFFFEFDKYGDLIIRDFAYFKDEEINTLSIDLKYDSFVNDNELVQPNVINRMLKKIYDFQLKVIELTNVKILNLKTAIQDNNILQID